MDAPTGSLPWSPERTPLDELLGILQRSRPAWQADGACREHGEVSWFPEKGDDVKPAKAICDGCLVLDECRRWSYAQDVSLQGIWGGQSKRERDRARRTVAVDPRLRVPTPVVDVQGGGHAA